jgi:hypothetical protein
MEGTNGNVICVQRSTQRLHGLFKFLPISLFYRYYSQIDGDMQRLDKFGHPELWAGSVDFEVSQDYSIGDPQVNLLFSVSLILIS